MNKEEILNFLKLDLHKNINMINFIENYPQYFIKKVGDSVLVKGKSDRSWVYISSNTESELNSIKKLLTKRDKNFAVLEDWMIPILTNPEKIKWMLTTMKFILPADVKVEETNLEPLTIKETEYIYHHSAYKAIISCDYIKERIENGISACIRMDNKLVAWAITQDDGAMGFLNVLPAYRHKGYAKLVCKTLINQIRDKDKLPFVLIEEDNIKSVTLAQSMGFVKDRRVSWVGIK